MNSFTISKTDHPIYKTVRKNNSLNPEDYQINCAVINEIEMDALINSKVQFDQIIDVRNANELPTVNGFSTIHIPLDEIKKRYNENPSLLMTQESSTAK